MDVYEKYKNYYPDGVVRPQPGDFVERYFGGKVGGFFVDVGAYDGITWSNSISLDENFHWKGICIEPIPSVYDLLVKNRPNSECINAAVSDWKEVSGKIKFWHVTGYAEMLSGIEEEYHEDHIERIKGDIEKMGGSVSKIEVDSLKLSDIIKEPVDYLSIDVEGAELTVLKSLNLSKNRPKLISLEDNGYTDDPMVFLAQNNYKFLTRVCGDMFYEDSLL